MQTLDLVGIVAFAVSGALMAIGRDYDVVGIAILAVVTALGGGIVRDLVLGDTPPEDTPPRTCQVSGRQPVVGVGEVDSCGAHLVQL